MDYVLLENNIVNMLVQYIEKQPRKSFDRQNINLAYGVYDSDSNVYFALTYFQSDSIKRCDDYFDDYDYAVITENTIFTLSWMQRSKEVKNIRCSVPISENYETILNNLICFLYENKAFSWEKILRENNPNFSLIELNNQLKLKYLSD